MRDIINATIDEKHFLKCATYTIARNGEGLTPCFSISIPDGLKSYWVYIDFKKSNGEKIKSPRIDITDGKIIYNIPSGVLDTEGVLEVQVIFKNENGKKWKTYVKEFAVRYSINATDDIPDKEDFIAEAQKLLDEIKNSGGGGGGTTVKPFGEWKNDTEYKKGDVCYDIVASAKGFPIFNLLFCLKDHTSNNDNRNSGEYWNFRDIYAQSSIADGRGRIINETYATKEELAQAISLALEGDY